MCGSNCQYGVIYGYFLNWVTRIEFSHVTYVHMKLGILTNSKSILESVQSISGHHYSTLWVLNWCPSPYPNLCPCPWSERSILGVNFLSSGTSLVLVTSIISSIEFWLEQYIILYNLYIICEIEYKYNLNYEKVLSEVYVAFIWSIYITSTWT